MKFIFFILFVLPSLAFADEDQKELRAIIADIAIGWEEADGSPFREHFLDFPGARYFESGGQNKGLDDLIDHHVVPEGAAIKLDLNFSNHQFSIIENFAWVLVDTEVKGEVFKSGRRFHSKGFQTFIFQKIDGQWKVVHTHSSSRPVKK